MCLPFASVLSVSKDSCLDATELREERELEDKGDTEGSLFILSQGEHTEISAGINASRCNVECVFPMRSFETLSAKSFIVISVVV